MKHLTDEQIHEATLRIVAREREVTAQVIVHLRMVEARRIFAKYGYSSLFSYCVNELKYCPASAQLRIDAMRLSKEVPEAAEALEAGTVTLTSLGTLQKFIREESKREGKPCSTETKREWFEKIDHKSKAQAEQVLTAISPQSMAKKTDSVRIIAPELREIRFQADDELMALIDEVRFKLTRKGQPSPTLAEVFTYSLKKALGRRVTETTESTSPGEVPLGEVQPKPEASAAPAPPAPAPEGIRPSHYSAALQLALRRKTGNRCAYIAPNGTRCAETKALQLEHIVPLARGGSNELENLTLLCAAHNRLRAIEEFGEQKMEQYLRN